MKRPLAPLLAAAGLLLAIAMALLAKPEERPLDIYWIDVEGGAATLIVTPAGESILIDTGLPKQLHIDRIAIDANQRGQGWGPAFYRDFEQWARQERLKQLCAEVNVVPPNPRSVRFHEIYGFSSIEEFEPTGSPDYRVIMLAKALG